jgi:cullin 1
LKHENIQQVLYQRYTESISKYLTQKVVPELQKIAAEDSGEEFLEKLQQKWLNHGIMVRWMQRFFQYLDRFYVEINSLTPLTDQGFKIFKQQVFQPLITNITNAILAAITRERNEELVDTDLLKKTVDIYIFLSSDKLLHESTNCRKFLEDRIVEQTRQYYRQQSQALL